MRIISAALLLLVAAGPVAAQEVLEQFSYDSLGFHGARVEGSLLTASKIEDVGQVAVRFDLGQFAPRLRVLVGGSYFRSRLTSAEIARIESGILGLVDDPDGNAAVDLGTVHWSDFTLDLDFQYLLLTGGRWVPYLGAGVSGHFRNGSGDRIAGTIVEDNLDEFQLGLNATGGVDWFLKPSLLVTGGIRGVLTGSLNTVGVWVGLGFRM